MKWIPFTNTAIKVAVNESEMEIKWMKKRETEEERGTEAKHKTELRSHRNQAKAKNKIFNSKNPCT